MSVYPQHSCLAVYLWTVTAYLSLIVIFLYSSGIERQAFSYGVRFASASKDLAEARQLSIADGLVAAPLPSRFFRLAKDLNDLMQHGAMVTQKLLKEFDASRFKLKNKNQQTSARGAGTVAKTAAQRAYEPKLDSERKNASLYHAGLQGSDYQFDNDTLVKPFPQKNLQDVSHPIMYSERKFGFGNDSKTPVLRIRHGLFENNSNGTDLTRFPLWDNANRTFSNRVNASDSVAPESAAFRLFSKSAKVLSPGKNLNMLFANENSNTTRNAVVAYTLGHPLMEKKRGPVETSSPTLNRTRLLRQSRFRRMLNSDIATAVNNCVYINVTVPPENYLESYQDLSFVACLGACIYWGEDCDAVTFNLDSNKCFLASSIENRADAVSNITVSLSCLIDAVGAKRHPDEKTAGFNGVTEVLSPPLPESANVVSVESSRTRASRIRHLQALSEEDYYAFQRQRRLTETNRQGRGYNVDALHSNANRAPVYSIGERRTLGRSWSERPVSESSPMLPMHMERRNARQSSVPVETALFYLPSTVTPQTFSPSERREVAQLYPVRSFSKTFPYQPAYEESRAQGCEDFDQLDFLTSTDRAASAAECAEFCQADVKCSSHSFVPAYRRCVLYTAPMCNMKTSQESRQELPMSRFAVARDPWLNRAETVFPQRSYGMSPSASNVARRQQQQRRRAYGDVHRPDAFSSSDYINRPERGEFITQRRPLPSREPTLAKRARKAVNTATTFMAVGDNVMETFGLNELATSGIDMRKDNPVILAKKSKGGVPRGLRDKSSAFVGPPIGVDNPEVSCYSGGLRCCVPAKAVPRLVRRPPLLGDMDTPLCRARFVSRLNMFCAMVPYQPPSCGQRLIVTGNTTVYRYTLRLPSRRMNDAICECTMSAAQNEGESSGVLGSARWLFSSQIVAQRAREKARVHETGKKLKDGLQGALLVSNAVVKTLHNPDAPSPAVTARAENFMETLINIGERVATNPELFPTGFPSRRRESQLSWSERQRYRRSRRLPLANRFQRHPSFENAYTSGFENSFGNVRL